MDFGTYSQSIFTFSFTFLTDGWHNGQSLYTKFFPVSFRAMPTNQKAARVKRNARRRSGCDRKARIERARRETDLSLQAGTEDTKG